MTRPRPHRRFLAAALAAVALIGAVAAVVALRGGDGGGQGETITLEIPAGTKARLDRGDASAAIPRRIEGRVGDTLVIVNDDRALHVVGGFPVAAGQRIEVPLRREGVTEANCTAHPDEKMQIVVRPA